MENLLKKLLETVELGKVDKKSPYPPQLKDKDGAYELAGKALAKGCTPDEILEKALIPAMSIVGNKFSRREIYVPQMLMSAKAMSSAMIYLNLFSSQVKLKEKVLL